MDENTLNDLLECSVCLERLDESKVLPCQHTFCRKCLEVIVSSRQELRCPECRVLVNVRIEDLPPNVLLMRILEGLKNAAANKTQQQKDNQTEEKQKLNQPQLQQQQQQQKPQTALTGTQRRCLLPHAYALYDFESSEPTDLHFKKGDLILLKHKIDINWYVGQLNGIEGTFPSNYVQVIVPLPSPQCIALYDFKMGPNEEEGCLNFKKGSIIYVLRRVDHNWAEGRIGNMIGIFPIAFVELNALAKQLLDSFESKPRTTMTGVNNTPQNVIVTKKQQQQQLSQNSNNAATMLNSQQIRNLPPIPMLDPTINSSDTTTSPSSSSLSTTTTTTTSPSASESATSSNSLPNSPQQSLPTTPQHYAHGSGSVRYRNGREKRHSLNALLTSGGSTTPVLSILQTNRHSAEILSIPSDELVNTGCNPQQDQPSSAAAATSTSAMPQSSIAREQRQSNALQTATSTTSTRANVLKTACGHSNIPASLPWGYLALYPYKPRKHDELELKKGCVYIVTERCLDGWFKGKNWQDISGVFPGNYVTPLRARDQQQLMHQWKYVPQQQTINQSSLPQTVNTQLNNSNKNQAQPIPIHQIPPELPPRNTITTTCASVWTKPLSHTVEAFFNRSNTNEQQTSNNEKTKEKESKSKDSTTSAAVSLMKRLTHIKSRPKSPASASRNQTVSPSIQQTIPTSNNLIESVNNEENNEQTPTNAAAAAAVTQLSSIHPVHVRSGSCPSQLLQSLPHDVTTSQTQMGERFPKSQQQSQQHTTTIHNHGSERIKGHKERPRIQAARQSMDGTLRNGIYNNINPTPSVLNSKCSQQYQLHQQFNNTQIYGVNHRKSQSLDANSFIMGAGNIGNPTAVIAAPPLPPTLPMPMAMPNCNITAAAIAASATTKSTHSGRESRFRCIVPYPPNSDVELELHVGDIIYVQRKQKNGWYKGTHMRTQKTGLFPASFVEPDL